VIFLLALLEEDKVLVQKMAWLGMMVYRGISICTQVPSIIWQANTTPSYRTYKYTSGIHKNIFASEVLGPCAFSRCHRSCCLALFPLFWTFMTCHFDSFGVFVLIRVLCY
jgi:hypothetical protein